MIGASSQQLFQQVLVGPVDGSFCAPPGLGLAVIFGMPRIADFADGALYTVSAFGAAIAPSGFGFDRRVLSPDASLRYATAQGEFS